MISKDGKVGIRRAVMAATRFCWRWVKFLWLSFLTVIGTLALFEVVPSPEPVIKMLLGPGLWEIYDTTPLLGIIVLSSPIITTMVLLIWRLKRRVFG